VDFFLRIGLHEIGVDTADRSNHDILLLAFGPWARTSPSRRNWTPIQADEHLHTRDRHDPLINENCVLDPQHCMRHSRFAHTLAPSSEKNPRIWNGRPLTGEKLAFEV
jgi:hypothetical protein